MFDPTQPAEAIASEQAFSFSGEIHGAQPPDRNYQIHLVEGQRTHPTDGQQPLGLVRFEGHSDGTHRSGSESILHGGSESRPQETARGGHSQSVALASSLPYPEQIWDDIPRIFVADEEELERLVRERGVSLHEWSQEDARALYCLFCFMAFLVLALIAAWVILPQNPYPFLQDAPPPSAVYGGAR